MATVYKRASARRDLVEDYVYLAEHAGIDIAKRFLSSANESSVISPFVRDWEHSYPCAIRS